MSTLYSLGSFFIFLTFFTSSINSYTLNQTNRKITTALVDKICVKSKVYLLCNEWLKPLVGDKLDPNPVAALGTHVMHALEGHSNYVINLLRSHARALPNPFREIKEKYEQCIVKYEAAKTDITEATRHMNDGSPHTPQLVMRSNLAALNQVIACDEALRKSPAGEPPFLEANAHFGRLSTIIAVICRQVIQMHA